MLIEEVSGTITIDQVCQVKRDALTGAIMRPGYRSADYKRGIEQGGRADYITIAINNVWGGRETRNGYVGHINSYECIGYHSGSADFIAGVLDADCPVYVYRSDPDGQLRKYRLVH